jgi:choline dehydrogenase-like flavoprotein
MSAAVRDIAGASEMPAITRGHTGAPTPRIAQRAARRP